MSETPIYIEITATVSPIEPFRDLFIAQLGAVGFESFSETEGGFHAYIVKEDYSKITVDQALVWEGALCTYSVREIEQVN